MNKRSFWQRGNRGFLLSMILLAAVLMYVTVTQILLAQEKAAVREITAQVETFVLDALQLPLDDMRALEQDSVKAAAYKDSLKKLLEPLFVKDAAYLDESAERIMTILTYAATNEQAISSLEVSSDHSSVRIDDDVAGVSLSITYDTQGSWLVYDRESDAMVTQSHTTELYLSGHISFVRENDEWKIYRIGYLDYYYWS